MVEDIRELLENEYDFFDTEHASMYYLKGIPLDLFALNILSTGECFHIDGRVCDFCFFVLYQCEHIKDFRLK